MSRSTKRPSGPDSELEGQGRLPLNGGGSGEEALAPGDSQSESEEVRVSAGNAPVIASAEGAEAKGTVPANARKRNASQASRSRKAGKGKHGRAGQHRNRTDQVRRHRPAKRATAKSGGAPATKPTGVRTSLRSILAGKQVPQRAALLEIRIGAQPVRMLLFTDAIEQALLHWEDDPTARGFYHCPGAGCPACSLGEPPTNFYLLPAYAVALKGVGVLRVSEVEGPNRLATLLGPLLDDPELNRKLITIRRDGGRYTVDVAPVREGLDVGTAAIEDFLHAFDNGTISLKDTFSTPAVDELRAIPRIKNQLELLEGPEQQPPRKRFGRPARQRPVRSRTTRSKTTKGKKK